MEIDQAREILEEHRWEHPSDYGGFSPDGDYLILARNRDSDTLAESNWHAADKILNCLPFDASPWQEDYESAFANRPLCYDFRARHWAVGWVEYMLVRADAPDELLIDAAEILASLSDYPVLDEDDYSEREYESVCDYWKRLSIRGRYELCKEFNLSIFAARRDYLPNDPQGLLYDYLRTP